jgi:hypothetical protein
VEKLSEDGGVFCAFFGITVVVLAPLFRHAQPGVQRPIAFVADCAERCAGLSGSPSCPKAPRP